MSLSFGVLVLSVVVNFLYSNSVCALLCSIGDVFHSLACGCDLLFEWLWTSNVCLHTKLEICEFMADLKSVGN